MIQRGDFAGGLVVPCGRYRAWRWRTGLGWCCEASADSRAEAARVGGCELVLPYPERPQAPPAWVTVNPPEPVEPRSWEFVL
jgi:hypothetical protein